MRSHRLLVALSVCALVVLGCAKTRAPQTDAVAKAATIVPIAGTNRVRVHLTPETVKRLDIQTGFVHDALVAARPTAPAADGSVTPAPAPIMRRVIPFAAVMYAPTGEAFTYIGAGPQLYERTPIAVEYVAGDLAVLASGPANGTSVVTVGGSELSGVEFGVGE